MKLLVVDSDRDLMAMLTSWLKTLGYEVLRAYSGERAKALWLEQQPEFVIVDTDVKDVDVLSMCREMQSKHDALLLITTDKRDVNEEVRYLEAGADDYLHKPFFPSQLLARIRAVSRRSRTTVERRPSSVIAVGPIIVDAMHNQVTVHGEIIHLTPTESKLLHLLAINADDVCMAEQIVLHVWGYAGVGDASLIKSHIRHMRQKIEPDPAHPYYITTVTGVGYSLVRRNVEEYEIKEVGRALHVVSR